MKRTVKWLVIGLAGIVGAIGGKAQTWEQNLNVTLVAQVQVGSNSVKKVALNTKGILALLSNINNSLTNTSDAFLTNSPATPERLPVYPFPATVTVSDNYVVDVDGQSYTNNVDFTNTVTFTQTSTTPVTYVFNNAVDVGGGLIGYFVPDFPLDSVTAELVDTNGPAYHLTSSSVMPQTTPQFSPTAKLLVIHDLNSGVDSFVVRDGTRGATKDTDVTPFFALNPFQEVIQSRPNGATVYSHIDFSFNNTKGDMFDTQGAAMETDGDLRVRGTDYGQVRRVLSATLGGSGETASNPTTAGVWVVSGRLTISGGKFVPAPAGP